MGCQGLAKSVTVKFTGPRFGSKGLESPQKGISVASKLCYS